MSQGSHHRYSWIVDQLLGIRSLETQLSEAFAGGSNQRVNDVRRRMIELQLRLDLLDHALDTTASEFR